MEEKTIEKVLNRISEERIQDSQELKNVKAVQEKQQKSLNETQEKFNSFAQEIGTLKTGQQTLLQRISGPLNQLEELGAKIDSHTELLKKPLVQKVVHEHHVPKLLYATIVLFCVCLCFGFGWFQTGQSLTQYRNNDTKWRRLMLDADPRLTEVLQGLSTKVELNPNNARDSVQREEDHNQQVWELEQKTKKDSAELRSLKRGKKK